MLTMAEPFRVLRSRPENAGALTSIAFAAKRHWGYPESWILRWESELTLTSEYVTANPTFEAVAGGETVGFCAVIIRPGSVTLEHLWVLPAAMRRGVGRALFERAEQAARAAGASCLRIVGDPHAEEFYRRMGAAVTGLKPAPMDGHPRFLPVLEKPL